MLFSRTKQGSDEFCDVTYFRKKFERSLLARRLREEAARYGQGVPAPFAIKLINLDRFRCNDEEASNGGFSNNSSNPPESLLSEHEAEKDNT